MKFPLFEEDFIFFSQGLTGYSDPVYSPTVFLCHTITTLGQDISHLVPLFQHEV